MAELTTRVERDLIDTLLERLGEDGARSVARFVRQYYRWVPLDDLTRRDPDDLLGAALAHWRLGARREPGEVRMAVHNPDPAGQGWSSPHTVVELVCDDMPFLVDSVEMEIARLGYASHVVIHPMLTMERSDDGDLLEVLEPGARGGRRESWIHVELDREDRPERLLALSEALRRVLADVRAAVSDWRPMRDHAVALADEVAGADAEAAAFLRWLTDDHFVFLGYREYTFSAGEPSTLCAVDGSGLGILTRPSERVRTELTPAATRLALDGSVMVLTKANSRATVHRPAPLDYVGVKRRDADGRVTGERRFLGLYTTTAYRERTDRIPIIRGKVGAVLERAGFPPDSHDAKALAEICESLRRDTLLQITEDQLLELATGILGLGERQKVRAFLRPDPLDRFVEVTVCLPRDRWSRETRLKVASVLLEAFGGSHFDWHVQIGDSQVATAHLLIHTPGGVDPAIGAESVGARVAGAIRAWSQDLRELIVDAHEDQHGRELARRYEGAFPPAYQEVCAVTEALSDLAAIEAMAARAGTPEARDPRLELYRPVRPFGEETVRVKLFSPDPLPLAGVLEILANMGARVLDEEPFEIRPADRPVVWLYDFGIEAAVEDPAEVADRFAEVFAGVWRGELENDGLGELVLAAGLDRDQITLLRAVTRYLRQAGIPFSNRYTELALIGHPEIARLLVEHFAARHDPTVAGRGVGADDRADAAAARLDAAIDAVASLDQDRILRSVRAVIDAVLRTNHYRRGPDGRRLGYLSFKLDPARIALLPEPRPRFEIFVYSPRVEGVHLRGGAVARGGLRWSDRREDFRTEVLGLMKAQMVKNALIVPVGSKGGFVVKQPPVDGSRERLAEEGVECYRTFLRGLLDLTDNIVDGQVVPPPDVVRHDGDDPYLVVAADKGTATFSDIANRVSADYGFWLGDAFASGGSVGYDHKAMGITARGAWESVKRHFRELGRDVAHAPFTVVGIGDMAGDVFGNGLLLSEEIRLVAAFNHLHVFLDPDPDPARSFAERRRLFELPRSAWSDYAPELISPGGGVFSRAAKQIPISEPVRARLGIEAEALTPAELISAILRAPVDLLWNGGIGTYVKARDESHAEVGDRANDALRVDGGELRARVVGEGGNLGFTQRGRIEFARGGGAIYTDAIDNVAGVNCSDHEVNIKILLDAEVVAGRLDPAERDALLAEMTDAVAASVLAGSYRQTQALSIAAGQAPLHANLHARVIDALEAGAGLDRALEFLPGGAEIAERQAAGQGLTPPELAVLMAHVKIHLDAALLSSDLPEDPSLVADLRRYFPAPLPARFGASMEAHRLRREIIATTVANEIVDRQGMTFAFRVGEETGAAPAQIARAYAIARDVFGMREIWEQIEALDNRVPAASQLSMLLDGRRLIERAVRWLVRAHPDGLAVEALVERYRDGARLALASGPDGLDAEDRAACLERAAELTAVGVPEALARTMSALDRQAWALAIVELARATGVGLELALALTRRLTDELSLSWLERRIIALPRADRWQSLARDALRDDLATLRRLLASGLLDGASTGPAGADGAEPAADALIAGWRGEHTGALERYHAVLADIRECGCFDTTTLPVALRELRNLVTGIGNSAA